LFRLIDDHFDELKHSFFRPDDPGSGMPRFVDREFSKFLTCGDPTLGFIRLRCEACSKEHALPFACKTRVLCSSCGARRTEDLTHHLMENVLPNQPLRQWVLAPPFELAGLLAVRGKVLSFMIRCFIEAITRQMVEASGLFKEAKPCSGAVVFVQRFTKQMSLYPHLHCLVLDGVYAEVDGELRFFRVEPPTERDLTELGRGFFQRFEAFLKRDGYLDQDQTQQELNDVEAWALQATQEPSLLGRGNLQVKRQSLSTTFGGFSIHAGVSIKANDRRGREKLVRYVARPPFSEEQLSLTSDGQVL